jgi:AcrR family transcriptional regulator
MAKRKYQLKRRAERQEATRQRIIEAAVELHETVGGLNTTISAVAERAGVERLTVYRHFHDEWELARACVHHYYALYPQPDPGEWQSIDDPEMCLRTALSEIYAYHGRTEAMSASARMGAAVLPELHDILAPYFDHWLAIRDMLADKFQGDAEGRRLLWAAIGHAIDFGTWRSLVREQGLDEPQAVALMVGLVMGCRTIKASG